MTSRSFKPSSLSLRPQRPSTVRRSSSASSTKSRDCPSPLSYTSSAAASPSETSYFNVGLASPLDPGRSRPIAIEIPPRRKSGQAYTPTPPEPLSARGEKLGGYFPFHEDIKPSYKPHPFNNNNNKSSSSNPTKSKNETKDTSLETRSPLYQPVIPGVMDPPQLAEGYRAPAPDPLLAAMPIGKYHPSNYKNKVKIPEKLAPLAQASSKGHSRKKSDVKKKLQQYQREMVEQAAIAGNIQLAGGKPTSPRLLPLSSPGPVTPMELEEDAGYLGARSDGGPNHQDMVAAMIRAEQERDRLLRDGERSPTITAAT